MSIDTEQQVQNGHAQSKLSASQKRRQKRKNKKESQDQPEQLEVKKEEDDKGTIKEPNEDIQIEYIAAPIDFEGLEDRQEVDAGRARGRDRDMTDDDEEDEDGYQGLGGLGASRGLGAQNGGIDYEDEEPHNQQSALEDLKRVFQKFYTPQQLLEGVSDDDSDSENEDQDNKKKSSKKSKTKDDDDLSDDFDEDDDEDDENRQTAQKKKEQRINIAELKAFCERPEVVEVWDTTADDPKLLTFLKAYRNTVPVPRHWSQKRKYLQGKRGIEKPPFVLPDFIEATGISELRNVYSDKEDDKKLKQKQREKMQPKMNKLDIAPEILIDAFSKHQTIPNLTHVGDLYYEGKEFEAKPKDIKPGALTSDLKRALGMLENAPPPWLINMQRYGPPPSYPYLKISGLNAPIPKGVTFGYQPGGWGKPPVNENGEPLYGDVFGEQTKEEDEQEEDRTLTLDQHWGEEMEEGPEEEEESSEEESEKEDDQERGTGMDSVMAGVNSSIPTGLISPEEFNLRKMGNQSVDTANPTPALYQVLEQKRANTSGNLMGGDHVYVMPDANKKPVQQDRAGGAESGTVQMAIDPEVLEDYQQDPKALQALYDQQLLNEASGIQSSREGFMDMVAQNNAAQKRKMQEQREKQQSKKQKQQQQQFKF